MKTIKQPLKVVDTTEETLTIEGYVAIFGDEQHRDFDGEYFHDGTLFDSGYTKVNAVVTDWEHGQEPDMDEQGQELNQPGRHDPLGLLDWTTARNDGIGMLARAVLNRREWYVRELVEPLAMAGMLGGSSEAVPGKVVKNSGRIDVWPLMRYALTVTPADPRQITEHQIMLVKSLANKYPALKALTQAEQTIAMAPGVPTRHAAINPTLQNDVSEWSASNFVIPPGYPVEKFKVHGGVIRVYSGDNVSIETQIKTDGSQSDTVATQEGEQLQAASAPATATPEDKTGDDELTPEQVQVIGTAIQTFIATLKEQGL